MISAQLKQAIAEFDLEGFLKREGVTFKPAGEERIMDCPVCSEEGYSDKLWVNVKKRVGWCYVCEQNWPLTRLVGHFLDLDVRNPAEFAKVSEFICDETGVSASSSMSKTLQAAQELLTEGDDNEPLQVRYQVPPEIELPDEFVAYERGMKLPDYFVKRGITKQQALQYGLGWCESGYYKNRMIIPVTMRGRVVSFIARYMGKPHKEIKKYLYPRGNPTGKTLFNYDRAKKFKTVVLTEGYLDAIAVGPDAMGLGGKSLTQQQALLLAEASPDEVIVMLDGDEAGREAAGKVAQRISSFASVRIAHLPDGKDPDELTPEELAQVRADATALDDTLPSFDLDLDDV